MSTNTVEKTDDVEITDDQGQDEQSSSSAAKTAWAKRAAAREEKAAAKREKKEPGALRRRLGGLRASDLRLTKIVVIRGGIIVVDWIAVTLTALAGLPMLGAWLHQASGAAGMSLEGQIAFWLIPYLFITAMILILEVAVLRGLWRAGTRKIAGFDAEHGEVEKLAPAATTAKKATTSGTRKNRNRKRRTK